jgi:hypothetical protein
MLLLCFHPKFVICNEVASIVELIHLRNSFIVFSCCSYVQKCSQYVHLKVACINQ